MIFSSSTWWNMITTIGNTGYGYTDVGGANRCFSRRAKVFDDTQMVRKNQMEYCTSVSIATRACISNIKRFIFAQTSSAIINTRNVCVDVRQIVLCRTRTTHPRNVSWRCTRSRRPRLSAFYCWRSCSTPRAPCYLTAVSAAQWLVARIPGIAERTMARYTGR